MILAALLLCASPVATDGDSLRCQDGTRIRLVGVDAPELHGCRGRKGRVCVKGDPVKSRDALERLVAGRTLTCERVGTSYGRTTAFCSSSSGDISCQLLRAGVVAYVPQYDPTGRLVKCADSGTRGGPKRCVNSVRP